MVRGGGGRIRTDDPHSASVVLSQLSYTPIFASQRKSQITKSKFQTFVICNLVIGISRFCRAKSGGGPIWARTRDPCVISTVLYHLSYGPKIRKINSQVAFQFQGLTSLFRKEVIQPHLPVRLPCYDLVLLIEHTFDASLPPKAG